MVYIIIGALLIGLSLGMMGSGGSILTVPMLVYLLGHDGKAAIAESLAIVGGIALLSLVPYARSRLIDWRSVLLFGVPGMAGTYLGAWLSEFVPGAVQLIVFALVMLAAAWLMFQRARSQSGEIALGDAGAVEERPAWFWLVACEGLAVGIVTGLVGVGGGFLIVPALAILGKLPMRMAIGTSLAVVAVNSALGLYKHVEVLYSLGTTIDWTTVGVFVLIGVVGSLVGHRLAARLNQQVLQKAFAVFLVAMSAFVLANEIPKFILVEKDEPAAPISMMVEPGESGEAATKCFRPARFRASRRR